jgi:ribosomal protein S18 acetylase RimI-like enzyme
MFDTSRRLTKKMIRSILTAVRGKHEWGFQRFHVAVVAETEKVVGVLRMDSAESGIGLKHFTSIFILIIIIIRYIGITGLIRTIRNSKAVQAASYPIFQSDELQIPYLAVDGEHRRKSIGSELLKFALAEARNKGKEYAALEVREHNKTAISFFMQNGFEKDSVIESEYDYLFGKGRRFRMKKKVELENTPKIEPAVEKNKKLSV